MENGEQTASAAVEVPAEEKRAEGEDVTMEDAMAAIAVSGNALRAENVGYESANEETASVASDGTVDLEQMQLEEEQDAVVEDTTAVAPEVTAAPTPTLTADDRSEETPTVEYTASAAPPDANTTSTNDTKSNSSGSSSSSSDNSSSSDSDSSDSDVEDVTDQYKQAETPQAPLLRIVSEAGDDEDADAEQWFEDAQPTLEADGVEVVGVVEAPPQDDDDEEEDIFLTPFRPDPKLERGSATKRQRPRGEALGQASAGEETTSSEPEPTSDGEWDRARRRKKSTTPRKKAKADKSRTSDHKTKGPPPVVYTEVPSKYDIFHNVPNDDSNFPFLKGDYEIRGGHRAVFTGHWGFTEADFKREMVSQFEYSSGYLHGRLDGDTRPFSGIYGGYFNLRQFSGKISKIKEDHIELHFVPLPELDETKMDADDGGNGEADANTITQYEVFGEGKNRYGRFLVRGYFSAFSGRMTVRRRYLE